MKKLLLIIFSFLSYHCWSQSNMITIGGTVPSQLTICGTARVFSVDLYNPSPFLLTNDTLKITLPSGIFYQAGSITGATYISTSFPNTQIFLLSNIPSFGHVHITYAASAQCSVLTFISNGGITKNNISVNYTAVNTQNSQVVGTHNDTYTTNSYLIKQPYLTITTVTNQSYTGNVGDVFTRCVTIVNAGSGELSDFTFTDTHGSGIQITSVDKGVLTNIGSLAKVVLNNATFASVGNHDSIFNNGESITICETVTIINCIAASSTLKAFWGCSVNACQTTASSANVVFPNYIPNLVITPIPSMNSCVTQASLQQLKIVNAGLGKATNVQLDIFQSTGSGYTNSVGSYIDPASFTIQVGVGATAVTITPTSTQVTSNLGCMSNAKGRAMITIPSINSGDTVYIKWNSYSCCYNKCTGIGQRYANGWRYKGTYQNICLNNYVIYENWGRVYAQIFGDLANDGSPSTLTNVQTGTFDFLFSNYQNSWPVGPGAYWKFVITLPTTACLSYSGNLFILRSNGINTWLPSSVTTSGNVVTAIFNGAPPWNLAQAELKFNLSLDCSTCSDPSGSNISVNSFYCPNNTCGCELGVSCISLPLNINCPSPCVGLVFTYFDLKRINYGLPDNEAGGGNGVPDNSGSLDFTKVKTNRAMYGDTVKASFNGKIKTDPSYPLWHYCFARSSMSNGIRVTYVDAKLRIYRGGTLLSTCNNFTPIVNDSASKRIFEYNLSDTTMGNCFVGPYLNNDSLVFEPRYRVSSNIARAAPLICYSSNYFYTCTIPNPNLETPPSSDTTKFQCSTYNGSFSIIGYFLRSYGPDSYSTKSCDNVVITQDYYLSIGPGDNNYAGGNLFPYEYRNWTHIKNLTAIVPPYYSFVSARFQQRRTAGTLVSNTSLWQSITPTLPNSDTLSFDVEQYQGNSPKPIPYSDDGFDGRLEVTIEPSCRVTPLIYQGIKYDWTFATTPLITGLGTDTVLIPKKDDQVVYDPPTLFLQSALPSVFALNTTTSWDVSISNQSNISNAINTWLSGPVISGVSIVQVFDLDNHVIIPVSGNIYQVGTVNASAVRNFRITATFSSCNADTIVVYSGWNCLEGYPTSVSTYPCTPKKITLTLTPLTPAFIVNTSGPSNINLCDTAEYIAEGVNVQLGTAYHVTFRTTLPAGSTLVPGTSKLSYPVSTPYVNISDPTLVGVNTWEWNISSASSLIGTDGLKGLLQDTLNSFKLKFKIIIIPNCTYVSGSSLYFVLQGDAACGLSTGLDVSIAPSLNIIGASSPYTAAVVLGTTFVSPCAANSTMRVVIQNHGPSAFNNTDSIAISLPTGVSLVNGSFAGVHNAPSNGIPLQYTVNGIHYLKWKLPVGVIAGDSTVFSFNYKGDPPTLSCDIVYFEGKATTVSIVTCSGSGFSCVNNITTGDTTLAVFTYKAYLTLSNGNATAIPNPPGGETVTIKFDITNTGQGILSHTDSIIKFYYDANGDSIYSAGDIFLAEDTIHIPKDTTIHYSKILNVSAGHACAIIAVIDPTANHCVCDPSQLLMQPPLLSLSDDSTLCSGQSLALGHSPITGYGYSWSPSNGLSDSTISNPLLLTSNITNTPVLTTYVLTTNRIGCFSNDTILITVNPIPVSNAGADIAVCPHNIGQIGTTATSGYTYLWYPSMGLNDTAISNPTVTLVTPGATVYKVITSSLGCHSKDSTVVTVNPIPVSNAGTDILTCATTGLGNIGTGAVSGYSYRWSPGTGLSDTAVSNPTVVLSNADTTAYIVTTSALGCFSKDTVDVTINPLPTATILGTTAVCKNGASPKIIFTGAAGTAPYTFTYKLNTGTAQTITTLVGDTVSILASTAVSGTYKYILISVKDSTSIACSQTQNDSVVITVNPLPTATITGAAIVCQGTNAQQITFTGALGTAPYTFIYTINHGSNQTITTTSGNSASVVIPTTIADTLNYNLISVQDASSTTCSQAQTDSTTIIINPLPISNFGFTTVCLNQGTHFNDSSSVITGTIDSLLWNFGDNIGSSTLQHPIYTYVSSGTFPVSLISITNKGCTDTVIKNIIVHPLPNVDFYTTPTTIGICKGTNVQFHDTSTIAAPDALQSWTWNLGDSATVYHNQTVSHLYVSANSYSVHLIVTSNFGCEDSITKPISINPNPLVNFIGSPVAGCEPLCISFLDSSFIASGHNVHWTWNIGNGMLIGNSQNFEHCYIADSISASTSFTISLTVTSDSGCVDSLSKNNYITVYPKPVANFTAQPQKTTVVNPVISFVGLSTGANFWNWNFGDLTTSSISNPPAHKYPSDTGRYTISLITSNQNGCKDTAYQTIIIDADFTFFIPNSFTPNDDGVNDFFFGSGIGIAEYELYIFDRWGNMVFNSNALPVESAKWDGRANHGKEIAQMDVYVWKVALTDVFGNKHKYIGTVTLVR
jgi:gliding motility-associated-like protein